jgi:hypothetical protein
MPNHIERTDENFNARRLLKDKKVELKEAGEARRLESHPDDEWTIRDLHSGIESNLEARTDSDISESDV